ncbi:hypothetical protein KKE92_01945 [Candidatus Micrarchaeota archaeon]|nr:hypothetical protein [Candidatus Micrarchaeota archaeon]MBU1681721.1 hypothetical protein [Candidatus Micrarchaeota archaeon]
MNDKRICNAVVYRQGPRDTGKSSIWRFVGQIKTTDGSIKRIFGRTAKLMGQDLAINIENEGAEGWTFKQIDDGMEKFLRAKQLVESNQDVRTISNKDFRIVDAVLTSRLGEKIE